MMEKSSNHPVRRAIVVIFLSMTACVSSDLLITTSGEYNGTYVSVEATYSGPLGFSFTQKDEDIEAEGTITIDGVVVQFDGTGTLTKNPAKLDLDVAGTDFIMHIEGELTGGRIKGTYTFSSDRWGDDSGTVDLG